MCFTAGSLLAILIWIVIICAIFAIIRLVIPMVAAQLGGPGSVIVQIINIVLWAILVIIVLVFAFDMISCLIGMGGGFPRIGR
jgi:hypothetical protein